MTVLCLWLSLKGGRVRLVVAGLWVLFLFCLFVLCFVCVCVCVCVCGGCRLKSGERGRLLGPEIFFFPTTVVYG